MLAGPETRGPDAGCSKVVVPLPHPGEVEEGGIRGGVGVGPRGHTEGMGESIGRVGGVVRCGRGSGVSRAPFNCDRGCGSSTKTRKQTNKKRMSNEMQRKSKSYFVIQRT